MSSVESRWHQLSDGTRLEVLFVPAAAPPPAAAAAAAAASPPKPPLLFLHGAFHGAWCWAEHFLPFYSAAGYDSYALSLRGHGGSELRQHPPGATGTLESHLDDLASFVSTLGRPPVLLAHSIGGLFAAAYAGQAAAGRRPPLAGLALLGAIPPSGTAAIIRRELWRHPLQVLRIGWTMARQSFRTSAAACRLVFFSQALPEETVERYRAQLASSSPLPLLTTRAAAESRWPAPPPEGWAAAGLPPHRVLVGCGSEDAIVDRPAVEEAAAFFGVQPTIWQPDVGHDLMLDAGWRQVADGLLAWLDRLAAAEGGSTPGSPEAAAAAGAAGAEAAVPVGQPASS